MENKVLVILGMHRSGTSLTAQWLSSCGLNLGDRLLKADFSNEKGHYEDLDFLTLHKEILNNNGVPESGLNLNIKDLKIDNYYLKKIESLIKFKNSLRSSWGWKEPRTCLFLDQYQQFELGMKYLIIHRPYREVVDSLLRRDIKRLKRNYYLKGLAGRMKWKIKRKALIDKINSENLPIYLEVTKHYLNLILKFLEKTDKENYVVVSLENLNYQDKKIINLINEWGFNLKYNSFNNTFSNNLINKNVECLQYNSNFPVEDEIKSIELKILSKSI